MAGQAEPFLRWAGSKRWLAKVIPTILPPDYGDYYEPFLGSGAVFFSISPSSRAHLSDVIKPLANCYSAVKDNPERVHEELLTWPVDKDNYYMVRGLDPEDSFQAAAKFIYLNKTAFNGLYRVNRDGVFNVPYGRPKTSNIVSEAELKNASAALELATLGSLDFEEALLGARPRDFVYLDPPYVAGHRQNGFVDYNSRLFDWADQIRLSQIFHRLDREGVYVLLSNADHESIRSLYEGYTVLTFERYSSMSARPSARGGTQEILVIGDALNQARKGTAA